jgi:hypothetical protein
MTITTHKRIHDDQGDAYPLCPVVGGAETRYNWVSVNCKRCRDIGKKLKFRPRQLKEIARLRRDKVRLSELEKTD